LKRFVAGRGVEGIAASGGFDVDEITPMRLRGKLVRFYLPDVLQELREKAKTSKRNVARRV
jgi:hypothetical protein